MGDFRVKLKLQRKDKLTTNYCYEIYGCLTSKVQQICIAGQHRKKELLSFSAEGIKNQLTRMVIIVVTKKNKKKTFC